MSASGGGLCGIFCFLDGSAPLGWKGRAVVQPGNGAIFAECCSFRHDERNMEVSSRGLRRAVELVRRINPAGSAGDSVAQSALSRFRTARSGCLSSRRLRKSMVLWALFHVKHVGLLR